MSTIKEVYFVNGVVVDVYHFHQEFMNDLSKDCEASIIEDLGSVKIMDIELSKAKVLKTNAPSEYGRIFDWYLEDRMEALFSIMEEDKEAVILNKNTYFIKK